jgi:mRNA interferase RelE/StbE
MASYKAHLKHTAEKDLRKLPREFVARVFAEIEKLEANPFPARVVKLVGAERFYRIRCGDYRIVYTVDTQQEIVTVHYIRHRREVYRSL